MKPRRNQRINSLLQEVLNETLRKDVKNPHIHPMTTIMRVEATPDLRHAKVYVSVMAEAHLQEQTLQALNSAAGFIAVHSSKRVTLRFFPELLFRLDHSGEHASRIDELLKQVMPQDELDETDDIDEDETEEPSE